MFCRDVVYTNSIAFDVLAWCVITLYYIVCPFGTPSVHTNIIARSILAWFWVKLEK